MKTSFISILITLLVLLFNQSCVVYQTNSVSLSQAHNKGKVKIITESHKEFIFKNIELKDSIYYGVIKYLYKQDTKTKEAVTVAIDSTFYISNIYLKDLKKSKDRTTLLIVSSVPMGFVLGVGIIILYLLIAQPALV